jgi:hypothetical protein
MGRRMSEGARGRGRVVFEGLLIVLSILLAFGIEAWWGEQGERRDESEALQGLHEDFGQTVDRLVEARSAHAKIRTASERLLFMTGPNAETSDSDIVLDSLVMALIGGPIVFPVMATYDALIASGQVEILSSGELRRALATWAASMADLARLEREARAQMDQRLLPFLWDYIPIVTLDLNVLPEYAESTLERSRFPSRYRDLLRSLRFENAVEERMNSSRLAIERVAIITEASEGIVSLLEAELR